MIISDLDYVQVVSDKNNVKGGYTRGEAYAYAYASGSKLAITLTKTYTAAYSNSIYISQ